MEGKMSQEALLFAYGTLALPNVQIATFGRVLDGVEDAVSGFELMDLEITDFDVISKSGKHIHKITVPSGDKTAKVMGKVIAVTSNELRLTDDYEVEQYSRKEIMLESGKTAWAYMAAYMAN